MYYRRGGSWKMRLIIAGVIGVISLISYYSMTDENPITGEDQRVALSAQEEIALGEQAAPQLIQQYGGLDPDPADQATVDRIGQMLVRHLEAGLVQQNRRNPYPFEFHLLKDDRTINAFALPGGQVFITSALFDRLETEGQLAGVLGHEVGHVVMRHSAQQLAKSKLTQGLGAAAGVAAGDVDSARMAQAVGQMINMKYGRDHELESDKLGVELMVEAGYDPRSMLGVMDILAEAGGGGTPEFLSTHPKPDNRKEYIEDVIRRVFPGGLPPNLKQ